MPNGTQPKTRWTDPGTLIGMAGLIMVAYGSYKDFQSDSVQRIADIDKRVAVLETKVGDLRGGK